MAGSGVFGNGILGTLLHTLGIISKLVYRKVMVPVLLTYLEPPDRYLARFGNSPSTRYATGLFPILLEEENGMIWTNEVENVWIGIENFKKTSIFCKTTTALGYSKLLECGRSSRMLKNDVDLMRRSQYCGAVDGRRKRRRNDSAFMSSHQLCRCVAT